MIIFHDGGVELWIEKFKFSLKIIYFYPNSANKILKNPLGAIIPNLWVGN